MRHELRKKWLSMNAGKAHAAIALICLCLLSDLAAAEPVVTLGAGEERRLAVVQGEGQIIRFATSVDSVFVADTEIADIRMVSSRVAYVLAKQPGRTNLLALDARGDLQGSVNLTVRTATEHALMGGDVSYVNTYPGTPQINIRVRFAELSRDKLLQYGIDWEGITSSGDFSFELVTGNHAANAVNTLTGSMDMGDLSLQSKINALQERGVLEILAEPNITALSGQTASFLAGGEVPIPVPVSNDAIGIEYKSFGVSLEFTPTLLPNDRIALRVRPEVSSLSQTSVVGLSNFDVPMVQVRRADTKVEVGSGQTFAIAGLFQRTSDQGTREIPGLGSIPILGQLFQSQRFQSNETELVILITPYLVRPSSNGGASPLDTPKGISEQETRNGVPQGLASEFGFYVD